MQIDWNKPIEVKVWDLGDLNSIGWVDGEYVGKRNTEKRFDVKYKTKSGQMLTLFAEIDGKIMAFEQIGQVRNKAETVKRPTVFEGKIEKMDIGALVDIFGASKEASISKDEIKEGDRTISCSYARDGIIHAPLSYKHGKHDMVIYYEDLGDKVKILDWEGIKSWDEIDSMGVIDEYYNANERVYERRIFKNYLVVRVKHTKKEQGIDINKNAILTWEQFNQALQIIKKAAENLHRIRQEQKQTKSKKMKAVI